MEEPEAGVNEVSIRPFGVREGPPNASIIVEAPSTRAKQCGVSLTSRVYLVRSASSVS